MNKAVFFDRDGTIIEDVNYISSVDKVKLLPHIGETIHNLNKNNYYVIVITNQSGVARGYFDIKSVYAINNRINELLKPYKAHIDDFYFCPHHPNGIIKKYAVNCNCRKPNPGLYLQAIKDYNLNISQCYAIGDNERDLISAEKAGLKKQNLKLVINNKNNL